MICQPQSEKQTIAELERRVELLDEYASTLEKENLAKNTETETIYQQLSNLRTENDVLRNHLATVSNQFSVCGEVQQERLQERAEQQVRTSVSGQHPVLQYSSQQQTLSGCQNMCEAQCQTEEVRFEDSSTHRMCTEEIGRLTQVITQTQTQLTEKAAEAAQMFHSIENLERLLEEECERSKQKDAKLKSYHEKICLLDQENKQVREALEESIRSQSDIQNSSFQYEHEVERLVMQNNQMIEKIRLLEKEKNSYYRELRSVSPLKVSQISNRDPRAESSKFKQGRQTQDLKNQRWKKIEQKISQLKQENAQIKENLSFY